MLLEIRVAVLKYVRFCDLTQVEHDKLFELIDMIEYSLSLTVSRTDLSLHPPVLPAHHKPTSIPMTRANELTLQILPVHYDEPVQAKTTVTKLEKQDVSPKSSPVLR